jgi:hypothetical protein
MNGLIAIWNGPIYSESRTINSITYNYYIPSLANWYVCDGSQINEDFTTPNIVGYIPVGLSPTDTVNILGDVSGNVSLSEYIPINNHSHEIQIDSLSSLIKNIKIDEISSYTIDNINSDTSGIQSPTTSHLHNLKDEIYATTTLNVDVSFSETGSNYRFNYVSQHYIIYYSTISSIPFIFRGMIFNWYGNITSSYPYQPIDSNNDILTDWYVCSSLNQSVDSSIPDIDNKIAVISTTGYETIDLSSTSIREAIDVESHTHTSTISTSISSLGSNNIIYNPLETIIIGNTTLENIYELGTSISYNVFNQHSHSTSISRYTFNEKVYTNDLSNNIFKYINLYFIIYLPS